MTTKLTVEQVYKQRPRPLLFRLIITIIVGAIFVWSFLGVWADFDSVNLLGINSARSILRGMISPDMTLFFLEDGFGINFGPSSVPYLMLETVIIAFLGTILGMFLAIPVAFVSSRNITGKVGSFFGNVLIIFIRTIPSLVIGLAFARMVGPGAFAGVLAIGFTSVGMLSKLFVESIEDMNKGVIEGLDSTGATGLQKIRFGILPQLNVNFISHSIYRLDINVRNATILSLVGAGGIGFSLQQAISNARWEDAAAYLWGIIVVVLIVEFSSSKIRNRLINGKR